MNAYVLEGQRHLREGDFVEAIRALGWAHDIDPADVAVYLLLIEAYEQGAEVERPRDPEGAADLLQQAFNVCRDLRDRRLPMSAEQQGIFLRAFVRVRDGLVAARRNGWTPPPPKDQARSLPPREPADG